MILISVLIYSALVSWLGLRYFIPFLRLRLLDKPNVRSSHQKPTPRGGGLVFVLVASTSSAIALIFSQQLPAAACPLVALPLACVGFLDDRTNLSPFLRYITQVLTASFMLGLSPLAMGLLPAVSASYWFLLLALPILVIAVTAVINFTNFMDGLDGLVCGSMIVSIATASFVIYAPWPLWALVGSLLGFLFWNWSPAKVFMGDVGSTFLGAVFAGLVLQASSWSEALGCLLVATPLLGDACICVPRRLIAGQRVFQAHRLHLFQRLHQANWSHANVSLTYIVATSVLAIAMLVGGLPFVFSLALLELLIGVWLDQRVAVSFVVASKS